VEVYAGASKSLYLSSFKVELGKRGLEQGSLMEAYTQSTGWKQIRWDTPYPVKKAGEVLLLRLSGVTEMQDFDVHAPYVIPKYKATT